jgi:ComF family protein
VVSKPFFLTARDLPDSFCRKIFDGFLNLVYPDACFLCATPVFRSREYGVCSLCWQKILALKILSPRCPSCGLPLPNFEEDSNHLCGSCLQQLPSYSGARSFGYYAAEVRRVIHELKFDGRRHLVELLAPLLAGVFGDSWDRSDFDYITAVPLHPKRRRERGFNQAELLAKGLCQRIAIPYIHTLKRLQYTLPQVGLTDSQRRANIRQAFHCIDPQKIAKCRILLIDDVMTTGATVAGAAQTLVKAGAGSVSVLTVARTVR